LGPASSTAKLELFIARGWLMLEANAVTGQYTQVLAHLLRRERREDRKRIS
jgi:hypothetical protein